tara:strand:+ start:8390 stop:9280 length:891 start_codon:yes stop_codon:yes gene_type:complete
MRIFFENVNLNSTSGPNSFAKKLVKYTYQHKHTVTNRLEEADVHLCFIESRMSAPNIPLFQRLDGIYFNKTQDFESQNSNIKKTFHRANGVIFQTQFNKDLTFKYFGEHANTKIIHNGADIELIPGIKPLVHSKLKNYDNIWACASKWRPHKRLSDNINYFLEHSGANDCLVVAGHTDWRLKNERIIYIGEVSQLQLLSLYKAAKYFIHLAWLDHCPNVVIDSRACDCQVICSSSGGTKEIAGLDAIVIEEEQWDFKPVRLYEPPQMDFSRNISNSFDSDYDMKNIAKEYCDFLGR